MRYRTRTAGRNVSSARGERKEDRRQRSASPQLRHFAHTLRPSSTLIPSHLSDGTWRPHTSSISPPVLCPAGLSPSDIETLFKAKCLDLSVDPTSRQLYRFRDYCLRNIIKRHFSIPDCGLSLHSARVVAKLVGNNFHFAYVNLSRNMLRDQGVVLLVTLLQTCVNLVHLDVSSNDVSPVGAQQTLSVLSSHKSLTSLDLSSHEGLHRNRLSLAGAESLRDYLKTNPLPTHLNATGTALGSEGCEILASGLLVSRSLLSISVGNNAITARGVETLSKALASSPVKLLCISENPIGGAGCEALSGLLGGAYGRCTLEQLDLSKCEISLASLQRLTHGCHRTASLTLLQLHGNPLGASAGSELFQLLFENRTIRDLGLASCKLRSGAVSSLADGLARNNVLHRLNLAYNHFEDEGAIHLAAALRLNSALRCLDLSGNNIRNQGAGALGQALIVNSRLETLVLRGNNVEDVGGKALALGTWRSRTLVHLDLELNTVHLHFLREIGRNLYRNRCFKLRNLTPSLKSEIDSLSTTPQVTERTIKDLETKQKDKNEAENALSSLQLRFQSVQQEEESRFSEVESDLQATRKRSAACTKELWQVKETLTAEKQQGEREVERLHRELEALVVEVRGLEKTVDRLKGSFAIRRVEAIQRLTDLESLKSKENTLRKMAEEHLARLQSDLQSPVPRPTLPRQSVTPQPRRRRYRPAYVGP